MVIYFIDQVDLVGLKLRGICEISRQRLLGVGRRSERKSLLKITAASTGSLRDPCREVSFYRLILRRIYYSLYLQFVSNCRQSHSAYNRMLYTLPGFSIICLVLIFQTSAVHNHPFFVLPLIQSLVYLFWVLQK